MHCVVCTLFICYSCDLLKVGLENRLAKRENSIDIIFSGLFCKIIDCIESVYDHFIAARKYGNSKGAFNCVGLETH